MTRIKPFEGQSSSDAAGIVAALACLGCLLYELAIGAPAMVWGHRTGAGTFVCLLLPLAITFTLLHGSRIHREMAGGRRAALLLWVSVLIFAGAAFFIMATAFFASVFTGIGRVGPG